MSIATIIVSCHPMVMLVLSDGLSMRMLMSYMMRMLLLMMTLLLVKPRRFGLGELVLVGKYML